MVLRQGSQYSLTWDMVDWQGRMQHIPRTKNEEPLHLPLNGSASAALRVVRARGDGRVFRSERTGAPLEHPRHWFEPALREAGIRGFHWHDLRHTFASRLRMKGTPLEVARLVERRATSGTESGTATNYSIKDPVIPFLN